MRRLLPALYTTGALVLSLAVHAEVPDPDPGRFADSIDSFAMLDSKNSFPEGAVLFVGSSSIRFWPTATAFPDTAVINRGFGGSHISDVIHYYDRVIKPYAPSKIVLYAGDNDIAAGKPAEQVVEDYRELVSMVQSDFPDTVLVFISIKPSKSRWTLWPIMQEANRKIRRHTDEHANLRYADLATPLLDESGKPGAVFIADGLHLNDYGYALWQRALAPYLE